MDKNPDYTKGSKGNIATKCRLCGGQLLDPDDFRREAHKGCIDNYRKRTW